MYYVGLWCKKTAPNNFSNNFVKPQSIVISLGILHFRKFRIICLFQILYEMENGNRLKIHFVHLLADEVE